MDTSQYMSMFLEESLDNLQTLNESLLELEQNPEDVDKVNEIFRVAHTIKGMAATMGFNDLAELTHKMEDVLSEFREGELRVTQDVVTVLFDCLDTLEKMVDLVQEGSDEKVDIESIMAKLAYIKENGNKIIIFDLALPRDVDEKVKEYTRVNLYDIDDISSIDDDNKKLRKERMLKFKDIINAYIEEYFNWKDIRNIAPVIQDMKKNSSKVITERQTTLKNKCNDKKDIEIAQKLIKSTSDYYVNRAIEVLKEEQLKGQGEECIKILEKIFLKNV